MSIQTWIRDKWRGYTDQDFVRVERKMLGPHLPGAVIPVTRGELRAHLAAINKSLTN